jgi:hypothetical protein
MRGDIRLLTRYATGTKCVYSRGKRKMMTDWEFWKIGAGMIIAGIAYIGGIIFVGGFIILWLLQYFHILGMGCVCP